MYHWVLLLLWLIFCRPRGTLTGQLLFSEAATASSVRWIPSGDNWARSQRRSDAHNDIISQPLPVKVYNMQLYDADYTVARGHPCPTNLETTYVHTWRIDCVYRAFGAYLPGVCRLLWYNATLLPLRPHPPPTTPSPLNPLPSFAWVPHGAMDASRSWKENDMMTERTNES